MNINKIAKKIISNYQIEDKEQFLQEVQIGELSQEITHIGKYQNNEAFAVDTNGNDHLYALYLELQEDALYYTDGSLTQDDIDRDGENAMPQPDYYHFYKYKNFPFGLVEFKSWLKQMVKEGVTQGLKVWENKDNLQNLSVGECKEIDGELVCKLQIPDYALPFFVNGDNSNLQEGEEQELKHWWNSNKIINVSTTDKHNQFNSNPEFGLPCATTECLVTKRK